MLLNVLLPVLPATRSSAFESLGAEEGPVDDTRGDI